MNLKGGVMIGRWGRRGGVNTVKTLNFEKGKVHYPPLPAAPRWCRPWYPPPIDTIPQYSLA